MSSSISLKNKIAKFSQCELDCNSGQLNLAGVQHNLEPLVFQFLLLLIQHQGEIVSKQSVIDQLWVDKKPSDEALRAMVKKTREALKDDARNPGYIKTIPTKGYLLIPPVELSSTVVQTWFQQHKKFSIGTGLFVTLLMSTLVWYFFLHEPSPEAINKIVLKKTNIAQIYKDEVSTYYINGAMKNIVVENDFERGYGQLKIDSVDNKLQQKVVFNTHLLDRFWWSNSSQRLLVMRNDKTAFYMLQFYRNQADPFITLFEVPLKPDVEVLGFDQSGTNIFVRTNDEYSLRAHNLQDNQITTKPMLEYLEAWSKSTQFQLGSQHIADLLLYPANSSNKVMAVLRTSGKSYFQLFESAESARPTYEFTSNQAIVSAIWNTSDERFSFTTNDGQLFSFQSDSQRLTSWNSGGEAISRIVVDCGSDCFIVANTQDLPKLSEISNPFRVNSFGSNSQNVSNNEYAQLIQTNSIARNESLPIYTEQGLYFVNQSSNDVSIMFKGNSGEEVLIYNFDDQASIDELVLDKTENILAGLVNQRPFLLDLNTQKLSYLALNLPLTSHFDFNENNHLLYYGKTIDAANQGFGEQAAVDEQQAGRRTAGLYEYNLSSRQSRLLSANVKAQQSIDLVSLVNNEQVRQKAKFQVDSAQYAKLIFRSDRAPLDIGPLANDCISCWQIQGNYLYTLAYSNENKTLIKRINLLTGEQEQVPILLDSVLTHFALHPTNNKIMLSTRQNLQTELIKIEGFRQIF